MTSKSTKIFFPKLKFGKDNNRFWVTLPLARMVASLRGANKTENDMSTNETKPELSSAEKFRACLINELEHILENAKNLDLGKEVSLRSISQSIDYAKVNVHDRLEHLVNLRLEEERLDSLLKAEEVRKQTRNTTSLREAAKVTTPQETKDA